MDLTLNIEPQTRWEREKLEGMRLGLEDILVGCVAGNLSFPMVCRWLWAAVKPPRSETANTQIVIGRTRWRLRASKHFEEKKSTVK